MSVGRNITGSVKDESLDQRLVISNIPFHNAARYFRYRFTMTFTLRSDMGLLSKYDTPI
jgi:hypothetical protein